MRIVVLVVAMACNCQAVFYDIDDAESIFEEFANSYSKVYNTNRDKQIRFFVFKESLKMINAMNSKFGGAEYGINKFTDLTKEEVKKQYMGLNRDENYLCDVIKTDKDIPDANAPDSWDWRVQKAVTPVKDQGGCGSCWSFSTTATLEGSYAIKHKELVQFSEQQLMDCDHKSAGCNGGLMSKGLRYLIKAGGAETEKEYPYQAKDGTCAFNSSEVKAKVVDCISYNLTSSSKIKQLLYKNGPISIAIKGDNLTPYKRGIISAAACEQGGIDHAVALVGYGTERGKDYWIVRNSWGPGFGEGGYFRMERGEGINSCGFLNDGMTTAVVA